jgi:putative aldouronate transport system permease protein
VKYKRKLSDHIFDLCNGLFLVMLFVIMVYPFLYVINYSISVPVGLRGALLLLPKGFDLSAYKTLFQDNNILGAFFISIARSTITPILMLSVTGMAAYALATQNLAFGRFLKTFCTLTMYVSAGTIASYIFMKQYHLMNNFLVYVIPYLFNAYNMILIISYIESIPYSLREAVYVDGGNDLQAYWRVFFPICKPVNAAILMFGIVSQWNSFMDTQLYCAMEEKLYTLQYLLYNMLASISNIEALKSGAVEVNAQSVKMAITVITVFPVMCVYPFLQKYFTSGIMIGSVKE